VVKHMIYEVLDCSTSSVGTNAPSEGWTVTLNRKLESFTIATADFADYFPTGG
jgi:hypothetical protein